MTGILEELSESVAHLGRVVVITVSIAFALAPLSSILGDLEVVTGVDLVPPAAGFALLAVAAVLEHYGDHDPSTYFGFAIATVACWHVFSWVSGLSGLRLELAPTVLAAEALVYLAGVATAIALTFYTDWGTTADGSADAS